ncbi:MAG: hypothetical protein LH468_03495, partial [Nocardioides sp.]|nr:hypothetical protein [Nocardioides sp.]
TGRSPSSAVPAGPRGAPTRPGDRFVLTTDAVHGELDPADLTAFLVADGSPQDVVAAVAAAVERTGADDNYQVLVVDLPA